MIDGAAENGLTLSRLAVVALAVRNSAALVFGPRVKQICVPFGETLVCQSFWLVSLTHATGVAAIETGESL